MLEDRVVQCECSESEPDVVVVVNIEKSKQIERNGFIESEANRQAVDQWGDNKRPTYTKFT